MMPTFSDIYSNREADELIHIADTWGIELSDPHEPRAYLRLATSIKNLDTIEEIINTLPAPLQAALIDLQKHGGKIAWEHFKQQYGDVRIMGAAQRQKIQIYENPISVAESLWFRGLIGKAFLSISKQPLEYAVLPEELKNHPEFTRLSPNVEKAHMPGRTEAKEKIFFAGLNLADHICTFLAAQRSGIDNKITSLHLPLIPYQFLAELVDELLFEEKQKNLPVQTIKTLLENPRPVIWLNFFKLWRHSKRLNEIRDNPYFTFEGNWLLNIGGIREFVLETVTRSGTTRLQIEEFIKLIHHTQPNFLRKAGEYETRLIHDRLTSQTLRGVGSWMQVEGRFLRYMITGPLFYFGLVHLSGSSREYMYAFQTHPAAVRILFDDSPASIEFRQSPSEKLSVNSEYVITIPPSVPLSVRYHIARFCEWLPMKAGNYRYQPTPRSLQNAHRNGLRISQLLGLLIAESRNPLPPALNNALQGWETSGVQARLENATIVRVKDPDLLDTLERSKAGKFILERLNRHVIIINSSAVHHIRRALAESGALLDGPQAYND